jgi:hypothetical protein
MEATVSKAEHDELKGKYNTLEHRIEQLLRLVYGAQSERFAPAFAPEQIELFEQAAAAGAQDVE